MSGFWIVIDRSRIRLTFRANIVIADAGRDGQLVGNGHAITHEEGCYILFAAGHDPWGVIAIIIAFVVLLRDVEHRHIANVVVILHTVVQAVFDTAKLEVGGVFSFDMKIRIFSIVFGTTKRCRAIHAGCTFSMHVGRGIARHDAGVYEVAVAVIGVLEYRSEVFQLTPCKQPAHCFLIGRCAGNKAVAGWLKLSANGCKWSPIGALTIKNRGLHLVPAIFAGKLAGE